MSDILVLLGGLAWLLIIVIREFRMQIHTTKKEPDNE